jgi:hypothetical protein
MRTDPAQNAQPPPIVLTSPDFLPPTAPGFAEACAWLGLRSGLDMTRRADAEAVVVALAAKLQAATATKGDQPRTSQPRPGTACGTST